MSKVIAIIIFNLSSSVFILVVGIAVIYAAVTLAVLILVVFYASVTPFLASSFGVVPRWRGVVFRFFDPPFDNFFLGDEDLSYLEDSIAIFVISAAYMFNLPKSVSWIIS